LPRSRPSLRRDEARDSTASWAGFLGIHCIRVRKLVYY
jgi:hypothetical protein